jgi:cobaltochelatase CobT
MRGNLDAVTAQRVAADPISRATKPEEVPLPTALSLLLREKLTGAPIPALARLGTDMVRSWIEAKAGDDLAGLAQSWKTRRPSRSWRSRCWAIST